MISFNSRLVPIAIVLLLTNATSLVNAQPPEQKTIAANSANPNANSDAIDDFIRKQMKQRHIPGVSLAIVQQGKVIKATG